MIGTFQRSQKKHEKLLGVTWLALLFHQQFLFHGGNCTQTTQQQKYQFVSGVYMEEHPNPVFYETYIPIVLEYQIPQWNASEVTFNNWYSCTSETLPYKSCAVIFPLNKAISNLHVDFASLQPIQDSASHSYYYSKLYQSFSFCDNIEKHFSGIFIQKTELNEYIQMLKDCQSAGDEEQLNFIETSIPDYNYSITHPFNRMEMNFYETFYKSINTTLGLENVGTATLTNSRSTIQANLLIAYYAEKYRWFHALQDCQQGIIPHSLISSTKLVEILETLAKKPNFDSNYEFAIPLDMISKYFKLSLADCTFTNDSFVVRILFPVKPKTMDLLQRFSLLKLHPISFRYESKLCSVQMEDHSAKYFLYDTVQDFVYSSECKPDQLCQVSHLGNAFKIDTCATALLSSNVTNVRKKCSFSCQNTQDEKLVQRVGSDKLIFTGLQNASFITKCQGSSFTNHEILGFGANEITLPCKCQLIMVGGTRKYSSSPPCNETGEISVLQIEPWHFTTNPNCKTCALVLDEDIKARYLDTSEFPDAPTAAERQAQAYRFQDYIDSSNTSNTIMWVVFISASLLLASLQIYTLYKLKLLQSSSCYHPTEGNTSGTLQPKSSIDNLLYYKVARATNCGDNRNDEPEIHLLSNAHENNL